MVEGEGEQEFRPSHQQLVEAAEAKLRNLGLYVQQAALHLHPEQARIYLSIGALVGDVAFSARVQDPEQNTFDDTFHDMRDDAEAAEVERMRRLAEEGRTGLEEE